MIAQYTAASLVSENKVLAHPSSVDTIPTSGNQEDHVSMGWTSVRKLREVVANVRGGARRSRSWPPPRRSTSGPRSPSRARRAAPCTRLVRTQVPTMDADRNVAVQLAAVDGLLTEIVGAAEAAVGALA